MSELRVGMVGLGNMCVEHVLPLFPEEMSGRFVLQAVCDQREDVPRRVAEEKNVPFAATDYDELLERDDVDLVARKSEEFTLVGQTCRWFAPYREAHIMASSGELGDLLSIESRYIHDLRHSKSIGVWRVGDDAPNLVYHGVCHPMDTARWFAGT